MFFFLILAKKEFGFGEQDYGYVDVRNGSQMFWWLYYTTANVSDYSEKPLIMWLQRGPGGLSCGYTNFVVLGPLDLGFRPRNTTWMNFYFTL